MGAVEALTLPTERTPNVPSNEPKPGGAEAPSNTPSGTQRFESVKAQAVGSEALAPKEQRTEYPLPAPNAAPIIVEFAPVPDVNLWHGVPVPVRVRRLLKFALRVCGLRCIAVREFPGEHER